MKDQFARRLSTLTLTLNFFRRDYYDVVGLSRRGIVAVAVLSWTFQCGRLQLPKPEGELNRVWLLFVDSPRRRPVEPFLVLGDVPFPVLVPVPGEVDRSQAEHRLGHRR